MSQKNTSQAPREPHKVGSPDGAHQPDEHQHEVQPPPPGERSGEGAASVMPHLKGQLQTRPVPLDTGGGPETD